MDFEQLKQDVIAYSKTIGIDKIGFASASPFEELKQAVNPAATIKLSIWI